MAQFGKILFVNRAYTNNCLKTLSPGLQHLKPLLTNRSISNSTSKFEQKEISEHVSPDAGALSTGQKGIKLYSVFFLIVELFISSSTIKDGVCLRSAIYIEQNLSLKRQSLRQT